MAAAVSPPGEWQYIVYLPVLRKVINRPAQHQELTTSRRSLFVHAYHVRTNEEQRIT